MNTSSHCSPSRTAYSSSPASSPDIHHTLPDHCKIIPPPGCTSFSEEELFFAFGITPDSLEHHTTIDDPDTPLEKIVTRNLFLFRETLAAFIVSLGGSIASSSSSNPCSTALTYFVPHRILISYNTLKTRARKEYYHFLTSFAAPE